MIAESIAHLIEQGAWFLTATRCLRDEHKVIRTVLDCFEIALRNSKASGRVSREVYDPFIEFFHGFADRCHHCKEEDRLFPCMQAHGLPREGGPIAAMLAEHRAGREAVRAIAESLDAADGGDRSAIRAVLFEGRGFLVLLRNHISKENRMLFARADRLIQGDDETALIGEYRAAESEPEYRATATRCRGIADQLARQYGVDPA
ncbi:MAG: cation-binding protein [bacterium]|nr:cation-binding protein [bacterium]